MASREKATPGNKLYIYRLLRSTLGTGKQEFLPNVEKILRDDDIYPEDMGFESTLDMLRSFTDFVNLTEFKGGRVYVRLIPRSDWDKWLDSGSSEKKNHKAKPAKGKAAWKHNKKSSKVVKPVKPKHQVRIAQVELQLDDTEATKGDSTEIDSATQGNNVDATNAPTPQEQPEGEKPKASEEQAEQVSTEDSNPAEQQMPPEPAAVETVATPQDQTSEATVPTSSIEDAGSTDSQGHENSSAEVASAAEEPAPRMAPEPPKIKLHIISEGPEEPQPATQPVAVSSQETASAEPSVASTSTQADEKPSAQAEQVDQPATVATKPSSRGTNSNLPTSFWNEVHCKDELLSILTRTLPFDVDLTRVLEEDWQVARSTGIATGTRSKVTFPIRYLRPDGTHIELTIRRISRPIGGKHWTLALVDGDDGSGMLHEAAGLEGAPQADEGAWQDLSATLLPNDLRVSPLRELAQFCTIGSWDAVLGALTNMAAPERWDFPGEGVGHSSRLGILREYLCVTLHRLREQDKIAVSGAKDFCAANTGLMTPMTEEIYACFSPSKSGGAPWDFEGFAVAGSGELGRKITATFDPLPQPASYIESLDQVMPRANKLIALDYRSIIGRQLNRLPRGFLQEQFEHHATAAPLFEQATDKNASLAERNNALRELGRVATSDPGLYRRLCLALDDAVAMAKRRVRASFRLCAPAYDPQTGHVDLLLPLALIADGQADCALVLEQQPSGNYQASSVLTLPRAYACARVVSKYQPAWLLPEKVLAK